MLHKKQKNKSFFMFRSLFMFALLACCGTSAFAQPKDNSPYSRLGLGDLVQQQFAASRGFGGLSAAYQHPFHINTENPASLAFLSSTAFEVGLYAKFASLESADGSEEQVTSGNLRYMALAFPLQNPVNRELERDRNPFRWGMNLALVPYTQVGYNLNIQNIIPAVDTTTSVFTGEGGVNRFVFGNGFRYKNFAFGINAGFLFGNISRSSQTLLNDVSTSYTNNVENDYSVSGVIFDFGAQYRHDFTSVNTKGEEEPNGKSIVIGAYGNTRNSYTTRADQIYHSFNPVTNDRDTILFEQDVAGKGKLPAEFTLGAMYEVRNKMKLGAEFGLSQWSSFTNPVERADFENSYNLALGGEWTPNYKSYNSYAKRMSYRAGFRFGTDPRGTDGDLKYSSITLGLGMPIISKGSQSFLDWGFEFGRFGTDEGLSENFARITLGFTLNDSSWFFQRRYN